MAGQLDSACDWRKFALPVTTQTRHARTRSSPAAQHEALRLFGAQLEFRRRGEPACGDIRNQRPTSWTEAEIACALGRGQQKATASFATSR
jgi:hypothetical protein